jgi:GTP-binding protein LepA
MEMNHIRNFAIIAHIDHGKSTLSDRMLEITQTIAKDKLGEQFLDQNPISKKRGITIKLAPVRMKYHHGGQEYMLNLIDTPGHVDFSYEVSRTLAACEGAVLLVDATQGIQAQTVAHFMAAKKEGLVMIPVINKIDLPGAQTESVIKELIEVFGFTREEILFISAKTGENVPLLLEKIVEKIPSPVGDTNAPLRALVFDAAYDEYRGVVAYVRIMDGSVKTGETIEMIQSKAKTVVSDTGFFSPFLASTGNLETGEIGYIVGGIKDIRECRVGDTITISGSGVVPLPGYTTPKPMIFFGMYPKYADDFPMLRESLGKLELNDTALTYSEEYSAYLGSGFRVGFLGLLHAEIVKERLSQEFDLELLLTMPAVLYQKEEDESMLEPYMLLTIYIPTQYVGGVMAVCQKRKGNMIDLAYHDTYATLTYEMPYSMFIRGLSAELKSVSSGYASMDYEMSGYHPADLVTLEVKINDNVIDVLSELVYRDDAMYIAREKAAKLKDALPRQQFRQIIQAVVNGNIAAREEITPYRKDVLAKMSGGDRTRKDKLLEAQKKGKKRMINTGKVHVPQEALFSMIENH